MKYSTEKIGKIIKDKRINTLHWSQDALGKELGISGKQVSNYEKGVLIPPIDILFKLCEIFNCELGHLLGEQDYSSGTKLNSAIEQKLGLTTNTITNICNITGTEKKCVNFGYESKDYKRILNNFLSNPNFILLMKAIYSLDLKINKSNKMWINLEKKYGKEILDKAFEYYTSHIDYLHDENAEKLDTIYYNAINDIDSTIDKDYSLSFTLKVLRYEIREEFERLLHSLYPRQKDIT